jgi:plastocyanin
LSGIVVFSLLWGLFGTIQAQAGYEEDPTISGVTVSGRVTYGGELPKQPKSLPVHRDSVFCGNSMPNEALLVDSSTRAMGSVVVSLEGVEKGKPISKDTVILFQNNACRFRPRISAITEGSQLEIVNSDPIMHNTHIRKENRFGNTVLNVAQPAGAKVIRKQLQEPGPLDIRCDAHPFMHAAMYVFEHPYFAVTDETGQFQLTQVPPGKYRLVMWHEALGYRERPLVVPPKGPVSVDLELHPEE